MENAMRSTNKKEDLMWSKCTFTGNKKAGRTEGCGQNIECCNSLAHCFVPKKYSQNLLTARQAIKTSKPIS